MPLRRRADPYGAVGFADVKLSHENAWLEEGEGILMMRQHSKMHVIRVVRLREPPAGAEKSEMMRTLSCSSLP